MLNTLCQTFLGNHHLLPPLEQRISPAWLFPWLGLPLSLSYVLCTWLCPLMRPGEGSGASGKERARLLEVKGGN